MIICDKWSWTLIDELSNRKRQERNSRDCAMLGYTWEDVLFLKVIWRVSRWLWTVTVWTGKKKKTLSTKQMQRLCVRTKVRNSIRRISIRSIRLYSVFFLFWTQIPWKHPNQQRMNLFLRTVERHCSSTRAKFFEAAFIHVLTIRHLYCHNLISAYLH